MNIELIPIRSLKAESAPEPWFDLSWDGECISIPTANSDGLDRASSHRFPINFNLTKSHPDHEIEWIFGITKEGEYFFKATDDVDFFDGLSTPKEIGAHLGFYMPASDTLRLLEFVE